MPNSTSAPSELHYHFFRSFPRFLARGQEIRTMDDNDRLHSFNDKPAVVTRHSQEWYRHDKLHRDNGKPALIQTRPSGPFGLFRKPFVLDWYVCDGIGHNLNGPSSIVFAARNHKWRVKEKKWQMYGIQVSESQFARVTEEASKLKVPAWVALFKDVGILDEETISSFQDENGNWSPGLPVEWLFRTWGLGDNGDLAKAGLLEFQWSEGFRRTKSVLEATGIVECLLTVIRYEEDKFEQAKELSHV